MEEHKFKPGMKIKMNPEVWTMDSEYEVNDPVPRNGYYYEILSIDSDMPYPIKIRLENGKSYVVGPNEILDPSLDGPANLPEWF